jgi:predicted transcriptional regulator
MAEEGNSELSEIVARLDELEDEERRVSAERRRLHDRLNAFYSEAAAERERRLSARRKALHRQIDALRVQLGRTPGPVRAPKEHGHEGSFWSRDDS